MKDYQPIIGPARPLTHMLITLKTVLKSTSLHVQLAACVCLMCCMGISTAADNTPGVIDPTQSITYWKPLIVTAEKNTAVAHAQQVFDTLLRSWDRSRVAPRLFVVKSDNGPWAASLADGSILLSLSVLHISQDFGDLRSDHLLAFVLSHELAHQRADDLWHQKFLRIAESQSSSIRQQLFRGLKMDNETISDLAEREAQADHDGLIIMSSVGYDPYQVINNKDFFTAWVEQIWNSPCPKTNDDDHGDEKQKQAGAGSNGEKLATAYSNEHNSLNNSLYNKEACEQARSRALRARSQLSDVANQAALYQLGIYAYVSRDYETATRYFLAYGKQYPSRAVFTSLGLTELGQALQLRNEIDSLAKDKSPKFYYPLVIDSSPRATPITSTSGSDNSASLKRSNPDIYLATQQQHLENHIKQAVIYFQQAIQLEPDHPNAYLYLATSYLANHNTYMSRGILQGQYLPRFGSDPAVKLLIALTIAQEGQLDQARKELTEVIRLAQQLPEDYDHLNATAILYAGVYNAAALAEYKQDQTGAAKLWQQLAKYSKSNQRSLLFRLALEQLEPSNARPATVPFIPRIHKIRIGDMLQTDSVSGIVTKDSTVWINGDKLQLIILRNGESFILNTDNKVINAWQSPTGHAELGDLHLGDNIDRPFKLYGVPSRHLHLASGEYLAYDTLGVAIHLLDNKVTGWFLYQP